MYPRNNFIEVREKLQNEMSHKSYTISINRDYYMPVTAWASSTPLGQKYYVTSYKNKEYFVESNQLISLCELMIDTLSSEIVIPQNQADKYWTRAITFAGEHTNMKLKIVTDYLIETDEPERTPDIITQVVTKNTKETVKEKVDSTSRSSKSVTETIKETVTVTQTTPEHYGWLIVKEIINNNYARIKIIRKVNNSRFTDLQLIKEASFYIQTGEECD